MIYIRATAYGEPDASPLVKVYQYSDSGDELILEHSAAMVQEKLGKGMKVNVNEAMLLYCHHVASAMRAKKVAEAIEKSAKRVLAPEQVMVGVPETLRTISLDAIVDGRRALIRLDELIPSAGYIMTRR
ncbi:MAG: urease subunit gamma [Nitrososphaera sp.]